jgi:hypothetical protein
MSDDLLEKVARALHFDCVDQHGYPNGLRTWDELPSESRIAADPDSKAFWRSQAQAAIAAIDQSQSADAEQGAWEWLGDYSQRRHSEAPEDVAFTADQMVDAYLAGRSAQSQSAEIARLREAGRIALEVMEFINGSDGTLTDEHWEALGVGIHNVSALTEQAALLSQPSESQAAK